MISPEQGVGIEFETDGKRYITLPRTGMFDLHASVVITSYIGVVAWAKHFSASIHISGLSCKLVGDESNNRFRSSAQPKESKFDRIDVTMPAPHNVYCDDFEFGVDKTKLQIRKGCPTSRFDSLEECFEAVELTFEKKLGAPWILSSDNYEPWEETKINLTKLYET